MRRILKRGAAATALALSFIGGNPPKSGDGRLC
ncbi:hypothetical protein M2324_000419 [Rhodovulum sulfidophilum]|nr:hypothetical protein [Rhodovulum sulfidophilum]